MRINRFLLFFLFTVLFKTSLFPSNWTRFRGPNGTGKAMSLIFPNQWEKNAYLWSLELPPPQLFGKTKSLLPVPTKKMVTSIFCALILKMEKYSGKKRFNRFITVIINLIVSHPPHLAWIRTF